MDRHTVLSVRRILAFVQAFLLLTLVASSFVTDALLPEILQEYNRSLEGRELTLVDWISLSALIGYSISIVGLCFGINLAQWLYLGSLALVLTMSLGIDAIVVHSSYYVVDQISSIVDGGITFAILVGKVLERRGGA